MRHFPLLMKCAIGFFMLVVGASVQAGQCTYKPVMTDDEIAACKQPSPREEAPRAHTPEQKIEKPKRNSQEDYAAAVAAANATMNRLRALDNTPIEPKIGMTAEQAEEVLSANGERLNVWQREHPIGSESDHDGYDPRWGRWDGCRRNVTKTATHTREQWVCGDLRDRRYLYFDDGILTTIQE